MDLIRKAALNAVVPTEQVTVPEWDGQTVEVRGLTAAQQTQLAAEIRDSDGTVSQSKFYPALIIACVHNPDTGELVLDPADLDTLLGGPASVITRLGGVCARLSGFGDFDDDVQDLG